MSLEIKLTLENLKMPMINIPTSKQIKKFIEDKVKSFEKSYAKDIDNLYQNIKSMREEIECLKIEVKA